MTPPEAPSETMGTTPPAVSSSAGGLVTLRHRADFLRAARATKRGTNGFLLQARNRDDDDPTVRVGFTCSKKIGNAVARNRCKRRLRAIAAELLPQLGRSGWDYVLIGRPAATLDRRYNDLLNDLRYALKKVHTPK